jgi:hypothetical protein
MTFKLTVEFATREEMVDFLTGSESVTKVQGEPVFEEPSPAPVGTEEPKEEEKPKRRKRRTKAEMEAAKASEGETEEPKARKKIKEEDVRAALSAYAKEHTKEKALEILEKYNKEDLEDFGMADVAEEDYAALIQDLVLA